MSTEELDDRILELLQQQTAEPLEVADFDSFKGQVFTLVDGDTQVPLELIEVEHLNPQSGSPREKPGSLLFRTTGTWNTRQGFCRLEHPHWGELVLFLSQVQGPARRGETPDQSLYRYLEAVLN